jgi:UbiD family decarboxylase
MNTPDFFPRTGFKGEQMGYYRDLREFINVLNDHGLLVTIKREINKDTELMPLVRWQFRGLHERDRKAFLFENVTDAKGKKYGIPVLVGAHAACLKIYSLGAMCEPDEITGKWEQGLLQRISPKLVDSGMVQEEVHIGSGLLEHGGLDEFPIPISTPGFDNAPYFTAGNWITKDPNSGIYNIGNYRGQVKDMLRTGVSCSLPQHLRMHRELWKEKGVPMPVAVAIGPTPNIGMAAVTKLPYGVSEYDVAGGLTGEPVPIVKCKSVDLEVPANAEIVIEGFIPIDQLEREGPFGEYTGYTGQGVENLFFNVTAITHRKKPIWNTYISQFPPSESSLITCLGMENSYKKFLKSDLGLHNLVDVAFHNESGGRQFLVIALKKPSQTEAWTALNGAVALMAAWGKIIVVVDEDIDPRDMDSVIWALCFRMQPDRDIRITQGKQTALDPSAVSQESLRALGHEPLTSAIMINATRKWDYPPISLPKKEYMERAKQIWEEEGLPRLTPKMPWYGENLGYWTEENMEEAELALKGEHFKTGEKQAKVRKKG